MILRIELNHCTITVDVYYNIIKGDKENNVSNDIEIRKITINNIIFNSGTFIPRNWLNNDWGDWLKGKLESIIMDWDNPFIWFLLEKDQCTI